MMQPPAYQHFPDAQTAMERMRQAGMRLDAMATNVEDQLAAIRWGTPSLQDGPWIEAQRAQEALKAAEIEISTLCMTLEDRSKEVALVRANNASLRHELKITRRDLQAAIDRLKARYAASKNAERIAVRDLSIVSTALNKHDERMTGLLTELSNTKRVIREQAEKMDKLASENERLKEMLAKLQSGQDGGVTSCSGEPHIGADENTDVSSLVGCKWEQAAAAVVSEAGLPANESWCIGTNTEQESGQWDAYVPSATVKASMSYAVDPELAAQLIGESGDIDVCESQGESRSSRLRLPGDFTTCTLTSCEPLPSAQPDKSEQPAPATATAAAAAEQPATPSDNPSHTNTVAPADASPADALPFTSGACGACDSPHAADAAASKSVGPTGTHDMPPCAEVQVDLCVPASKAHVSTPTPAKDHKGWRRWFTCFMPTFDN